jgi:cytochrome b561
VWLVPRDQPGYRPTTKVLHWLTVALLAGQLVAGYLLDVDDGSGRGRGRGRGGEPGRGRGRGGEDDERLLDVALSGEEPLLSLHVALGASILLVAVLRLVWRRVTELPPWAECLSDAERRLTHWTERVLYAALVAMPLTGLLLLVGDDDLVPLHVTSHVVLYGAVAVHLGLVLRHTLLRRDRLLSRML